MAANPRGWLGKESLNMNKSPKENTDPDFAARRQQARIEVNRIDANQIHTQPERGKFFNTVYDRANDDAAQIPWADMAPKPQLVHWLANNPGNGKTAIDIACGLGDNAEEIATAGYDTTAFDLADTAIEWAKQRFPDSNVTYRTGNLFKQPEDWQAGFDLVNECYTLQALPPQMLTKTTLAIAGLVKPGGDLLVYTRLRPDDRQPEGPPWPLHIRDAMKFEQLGFEMIAQQHFINRRGEREIPHQFAHWRKLV